MVIVVVVPLWGGRHLMVILVLVPLWGWQTDGYST